MHVPYGRVPGGVGAYPAVACQGVCAPGQHSCPASPTYSNNYIQDCTATGTWTNGATNCSATHQSCIGSTCQGACAPGDIYCTSATQYKVCNPATGQFGSTLYNCQANFTCTNFQGFGQCKSGF